MAGVKALHEWESPKGLSYRLLEDGRVQYGGWAIQRTRNPGLPWSDSSRNHITCELARLAQQSQRQAERIETLERALRDVRDAMRIRAETGNYSPADMAQVAKNIIEPHMAPPSTPAEEEPEA